MKKLHLILLLTFLAIGAGAQAPKDQASAVKQPTVFIAPDEITINCDTYISEAAPNQGFAREPHLLCCGADGKRMEIFYKFKMECITVPGTRVKSVKLRLYCNTTSNADINVYASSSGFGKGFRWADRNRQVIGTTPIDTVHGVKADTWTEFELRKHVIKNWTWGVMLTTTDTQTVSFDSHRGKNPPQLIVTLDRAQEKVTLPAEANLPPRVPKTTLPPKVETFPLVVRGPEIRGNFYTYTQPKRANGLEFVDHDLLDGVLFDFKWTDIIPERGKVSKEYLGYMKNLYTNWINASAKAGYPGRKGLLSVRLQGLVTRDTPDWLYRHNGGPCDIITAKIQQDQRPTAIYYAPVNWYGKQAHPDYVHEVDFLIKTLAENFDNDPNIAGIHVCLGHTGATTVSMNPTFAPMFLAKGWNPEAWIDLCDRIMDIYLKYFKHKQLFIVAEEELLRDRQAPKEWGRNYARGRDTIIRHARQRGIGVLISGIVPWYEKWEEIDGPQIMESYRPLVEKGIASVGVFDDWPLYDPERLTTSILGYDYFMGCLQNAIGPVPGKSGRTTTSFIVTYSKELYGSYLGKPIDDRYIRLKYFDSEVRKGVIRWRNILFDRDPDASVTPVTPARK